MILLIKNKFITKLMTIISRSILFYYYEIHQTTINYYNSLILLIYTLNYSIFLISRLSLLSDPLYSNRHRAPFEMGVETLHSKLRRYCILDSARLRSFPSLLFSSPLVEVRAEREILCWRWDLEGVERGSCQGVEIIT